ncbi:MAG TPA: hypothetical protein VG860_11690 [Terriglobia bacterium]|nr:hypothetical protein [Terriglobia bacterium]
MTNKRRDATRSAVWVALVAGVVLLPLMAAQLGHAQTYRRRD